MKTLNPKQCSTKVYKKGVAVCMFANASSETIEEWVKMLRKVSGEKVDWYRASGRGVVKVLGDVGKVRGIINLCIKTKDILKDTPGLLIFDDDGNSWNV